MNKLTKVLFLVLFLSALRYSLPATYAAVPHLINYQGRLTDTSGSPLNGLYNITFRIYDSETAGNLLWQGTYTSTSVDRGIFNILLGDLSDTGFNFSNLAFDKPYWLEIKVGTDDPMAPRQRITSAGYAITAERLVDEPLPAARGGTGSTAAANAANGVVLLDGSRKLPAVDGSQLTGTVGLGSWVSKNNSTIYQAETDGFVCGYLGQNGTIYGWTDANPNPTTKRWGQNVQDGYSTTSSIMMPVKKGDYWKVTVNVGTATIFWIPLGR